MEVRWRVRGAGRVRLANAKQNRQTTADSNSMVAFEVTISRYPRQGTKRGADSGTEPYV